MSVLRCALFFAAVTAALGCDAGVTQSITSKTACGVNDDGRYYSCRWFSQSYGLVACGLDRNARSYSCNCPWFECTTTLEEFEEGLAHGGRFGTCRITGMTIAFIVVGVIVGILLTVLGAWCCCCKDREKKAPADPAYLNNEMH